MGKIPTGQAIGSTESNRSQSSTDARQNGKSRGLTASQLAERLAWFSIGLGLTELLAPRILARFIGVKEENAGLIRTFGVREIASGIAIFSQGEHPTEAILSRVAGDAMDLAALASSFASSDSNKGRVAFAALNVLAVTALDVACAQQLSTSGHYARDGRILKGVIIDRSPEELYQQWRNFENLPRFMRHLVSVKEIGENRSHWVANGPAGTTVEWDAEIAADRVNELISWRSLDGSAVDHSGSVRFAPASGNRGTVVQVEMEYNPPGGVIGRAVAELTQRDPGQLSEESLRNFKQIMETGERLVSDGTIGDNGLFSQRPAQPS
jgi:uncharacterized membrane protein